MNIYRNMTACKSTPISLYIVFLWLADKPQKQQRQYKIIRKKKYVLCLTVIDNWPKKKKLLTVFQWNLFDLTINFMESTLQLILSTFNRIHQLMQSTCVRPVWVVSSSKEQSNNGINLLWIFKLNWCAEKKYGIQRKHTGIKLKPKLCHL